MSANFTWKGPGRRPNHCWYQKTRVFLLPHSLDRMIVSSFVWIGHQRVTDRQTDGIAVANTVQSSTLQAMRPLCENLGPFQHNTDILKKGHGEFVSICNTTGKHSARSYLPCSTCYGFYYKYDLWCHSCPYDDSPINKDKSKRSSVVEFSRSILDGAMDTECKDKNLTRYVLC